MTESSVIQWHSSRVCVVCRPSAVGVQNLPDVCSGRGPQISREPFTCQHISRYHHRACTQITERFLNWRFRIHGILFPSTLLTANDDEMYAAAESLAKQYDTDISSAFRRQLLSFRSCFHSQLSTNSTTFGSCPFDHALSSTFSDVWTAYMLLWRCQWPLQPVRVRSQSWNWSKTSYEVLCLRSVSVIWRFFR